MGEVGAGLPTPKIIYRQHGPASRGNHFGGRIVQARRQFILTNGEALQRSRWRKRSTTISES
jgi:hypothetical protein